MDQKDEQDRKQALGNAKVMNQANLAFLAVFLLLTSGIFLYGDKVVSYFYPVFASHIESKGKASLSEYAAFDELARLNIQSIKRTSSPLAAKKALVFWMGDIEGKGAGYDLLASERGLDSLFPGYGPLLYQNEKFWNNYFSTEFGPDSFLDASPLTSDRGFRIAYSWTGCFSIYKEYGADILVLGSSEVYKSLIPGQLAEELKPLSAKPLKVLYCVTHSMPMETVRATTEELIRLRGEKPKAIIWGYSFWLAYLQSTKLNLYQIDKNKEFSDYLSRNTEEVITPSVSTRLDDWLHIKGADLFPKIKWDDVMQFSLSMIRQLHKTTDNGEHEGIYVAKDIFALDDGQLSAHLQKELKPFYNITRGVTEKDCSMDLAAVKFRAAAKSLKQLSPNVFVYLAPTTLHHRKTVPECFLPSVMQMLKHETQTEGVNLLTDSMEEFGLTDRDFVYPTVDGGKYYFDINHANYLGGKKISARITAWLNSKLPRPSSLGGENAVFKP